MKKIVNDTRLMIKVCDLYYNEKKSKKQIAHILNISVPTVSSLLDSAVCEKVVSINIENLETVKHWDLERRLKQKCGLKDVVIVDSFENPLEQKHRLGIAASKYLESIVKSGDIIGISMGSTLYQAAHTPAEKSINDLSFVSLLGGMGRLRTELHSNYLSQAFAQKYNGRYFPLYTPARVSNALVRKELRRETEIQDVLSMYKNLSAALVGIGYPSDNASSVKATGYYKDNEILSLSNRKVVGEICMQFYDICGDTQLYKDDNTAIGININLLKKVPYSIGVAGTEGKLSAIAGAVRGGFINVLITDSECAKRLISMDFKEKSYE